MKAIKRVIHIALIAVLFWMFLGLCSRRDVLYLMNHGRSSLERNDDDYPILGFIFPYDSKSSGIYWLPDVKRCALWRKILKGEFGHRGEFNRELPLYGLMYVYPKWVGMLGLKTVLRPFAHDIAVVYIPSKKYLYLSEDRSELNYEYSDGLSVYAISPQDIGVDMSYVFDCLRKNNVDPKRYRTVIQEFGITNVIPCIAEGTVRLLAEEVSQSSGMITNRLCAPSLKEDCEVGCVE